MFKQTLKFLLLPAVAAVLVACGGGSGGSVANVIKGVAATGAPIVDAPVYIKDANGKEPAGQNEATGVALVTTDANGAYSFPSTALAGLKSPFIVRVSGAKVLDSGDDATAILHAVVDSTTGAIANLTPLTEAATILTLGTDTAAAFKTPQESVANYTSAAASAANATLLAKLSLPAGVANIDLVSGELDAKPTTNLQNPSLAKQYDLLLDTIAFSSSQGQLILTDRNRSEDDYVNGPQISVSSSGAQASGGAMEGVNTQGILDAQKLQAFIDRFNTQLAAGCNIPLTGSYQNTCGNVTTSTNKVFSANFKHTGMTADKWLNAWVASPLDVENLGDVRVSLKAAFRGTFMANNSQRVTRVALKFARPNGDFVVRTLLLADEGNDISVFGNQKDYFVWARPRLSVSPDADDTYPYNPKYQVGMQFIVKHWYAGMPRMVIGAHIEGAGLPATRLANRSAPSGEASNPNGLTKGIEVFYRTDESVGCSNMAVDTSVYLEKNTKNWDAAWTDYKTNSYDRNRLYDGSIRWREGSKSCDPTFDMRRYYGANPIGFVLPKRGDTYKVTLYLDATKWGGVGQPAPPAAAGGLVSGKVNADGDLISYYPLEVTETLKSDAFEIPTNVASNLLPGVTDATRARLLTVSRGSDRLVEWTRNLIAWPEKDSSGQVISTNFGNFIAGVFMSSKDQMSSADNGYSFFNPSPTSWGSSVPQGFIDYRQFFTTSAATQGHLTIVNGVASGRLDLDCGKSVTYKGSTVRVRVRKVTNTTSTFNTNERGYEEVSCDAAKAATGVASNGTLLTGNKTLLDWYWVGSSNNAFFRNASDSDNETIRYQYDVVRDRVDFKSDKGTQVTANQTSRTLTWAQMMAKEPVNSQALCSSFDGGYPYRKAYVIMADMNGRQIMENREVWGDFPGMTAADLGVGGLNMATRYTSTAFLQKAVSGDSGYNPPVTRAIDISRPNYLTDAVYLPMTFDVSDYNLDWTIPTDGTGSAWMPAGGKWHAQPGVIQPAYEKASAGTTTCTKVNYPS